MFKSFFKTGWRSLQKNKLYSFINLFGLTVGITGSILIGLYITDELGYDKFNANAGKIVRVTMDYGQGETQNKAAVTGTKVGPQLKRSFSFVEEYVRLINATRVIKYNNKLFTEKRVLYADASFFKMFSFTLLNGSATTVLDAPNKVVLSQSTAKKYFGNEDAMGKVITMEGRGDYQVTGICADAPGNSQIQFDFVASFTSLDAAKKEEWFTANYITYLQLQKSTDAMSAEKQVDTYMRTAVRKELDMKGSEYLTYHFEPLLRVHLYSRLTGLQPNGNITYVYIMFVIGLLILAIACINYTNLATAQSATRLGEMGIRKVMGARRWQLFLQFVGESTLITFIALLFAVVASIQLLHVFNNITGKALTASSVISPLPLTLMALLAIIVSFAACAYPAFILSNSGLSKILRSGFGFSASGNGIRKSLIVAQFVISLFLIIATIIVQQQLHYMQHKNLGYDKDHLLVLPVDVKTRPNYEALKAALKQLPGVEDISGAYETPTFVQWGDGVKKTKNDNDMGISVNAIPVDFDFIKTMKMRLVAGNDFQKSDLALMDTSDNYKNYTFSFIINETAAKQLGWKPNEAVGKTIYKGSRGIVKAVVQDFHFTSLHETIKPLVIFLDPSYAYEMYLRINGADATQTISRIENMWKARVPWHPFEYRFLNDDYNKLYKSEQKTAAIFSLFAGLAIILACLGLFGLAAFTTLQRTKEIGVRKVLGAGTATLVTLLCREFLQLVCIAFAIAVPAGWIAAEKWLQDFAYRIQVNVFVFLAAGAAVLFITLLTAGYHAVKAALANPVKALRSE
jgi:putative ABC transport system permease protein